MSTISGFVNTTFVVTVFPFTAALSASAKRLADFDVVISTYSWTYGRMWRACGYISNTPENSQYKYLYFYVGDFSQTATEQTAGLNSSLFNGKADLNLANVSNAGSSLGASWSMPSDTYTDLTLGASGTTYTAPANGWYYIRKERSDGQYLLFNNTTKGYCVNNAPDIAHTIYNIFPVCKGDVVSITYSASGTTHAFRFYYAVGSESEA